MTGKIRMMSAGMGGASRYRVNPWGKQGGGNKSKVFHLQLTNLSNTYYEPLIDELTEHHNRELEFII